MENTYFTKKSPFNNEILYNVKNYKINEIISVTDKAKNSFQEWKKTTFEERITKIRLLLDLILKDKEKIIKCICTDVGKPYVEAETEVLESYDIIRFYIEQSYDILSNGLEINLDNSIWHGKKTILKYEPIGVYAVIKPWNYTFELPIRSIIPILSAGNTIVFKPSEYSTKTGQLIFDLLLNAEKANKLIENLAGYVVYIYPGIITIYLYNFFNAKITKNTQAFIIKSFAISYLYNIFLQMGLQNICFLKDKMQNDKVKYNIVLIIVAFVIPYIVYRFVNSIIFARICGMLGISTSVTNIPFELLADKDEEVVCLKVYFKDEPYVYIGFLKEYEYEKDIDNYIILSGYRKYYVNSEHSEKLIEAHSAEEYKEKVFIKFSDIKRIEKLERKRTEKDIYSC